MKTVFFKRFALILLLGMTCFLYSTNLMAREYQHKITLKQMTLAWQVEGSQLHLQVSGKTKGWVAVGFNPSNRMEGANIIIGYVKKGKVKIRDHVGIRPIEHLRDDMNGGQDNVSNISGMEEGGNTTIAFTIPLNSGDKNDGKIDPTAETSVILAYGPDRDSFSPRHKFRTRLQVNLSSGAFR